MQTQVIPSYLYYQYQNDDALQAFVQAYNSQAQEYITLFGTINLPYWPGVSGDLLTWVAQGLYGISRPVVPNEGALTEGPYNTIIYDTLPYDGVAKVIGPGFALASDDVFRRILTWYFYRGDGREFTMPWLKRRIERFLFGTNGAYYNVDQTYNVSIEYAGGFTYHIHLFGAIPGNLAIVFDYCVRAGILALPFQFTFVVIP